MTEYIEREKALNINLKVEVWRCDDSVEVVRQTARCFADAIKAIPAADVVPVVRGKWEEEDSASNRWAFRCSVCEGGPVGFQFRFCPNCGADMRQKEES